MTGGVERRTNELSCQGRACSECGGRVHWYTMSTQSDLAEKGIPMLQATEEGRRIWRVWRVTLIDYSYECTVRLG